MPMRTTLLLLCIAFFSITARLHAQAQVYTILFDRNSTELNDFAVQELELLMSNLDSIAIDSIKVSGYSDYLGNKDYNLMLSEDRAFAVENYLKKRISQEKKYNNLNNLFQVEGLGELPSMLTPPEGVPEHRKVDIKIVNHKIRFVSERNKEIKVFDPRKELEFGQVYILKRVHFMPDKPELLEQSVPVLNSFYKNLQKMDGDYRLIVSGHICCIDTKDASEQEKEFGSVLSEARALRIQEYLVEQGLDREQIDYEGHGFNLPLIYPEMKELDRVANRRVEVVIYKE